MTLLEIFTSTTKGFFHNDERDLAIVLENGFTVNHCAAFGRVVQQYHITPDKFNMDEAEFTRQQGLSCSPLRCRASGAEWIDFVRA